MMNISPLMRLSASRTELQSTKAEACCLDTAAAGCNDAVLLRIDDALAVIAAALSAPHPAPYQVRGKLFGQLLPAGGEKGRHWVSGWLSSR
jgi:hypothetical protein